MSNPAPQAKARLAEDGWRKRAGDFYTRPLDAGVAGLLALSADRGLPHQWRLRPYVGVVHEHVNALARLLTGSEAKNPHPQDTIRYPLVRLLDGPTAGEGDRWLIAAEAQHRNQRVFDEVAVAARDVGIPWMLKRTSLAAIVYELRDGNGPWRRTPYLAAALWLQGEVASAEAWLAHVAAQFGNPTPQIPVPSEGSRVTRLGSSAPPEGWPRQAFDAFARRLSAGMAQYPKGPPEGWRPSP